MPLSRGRKGKKKKKVQQKIKRTYDYEEFKTQGVKIYRQGKNIFIKTNRTQEQQDQLIENIKERRPQILETVKESISRITEIFSTYDNFQLLGGLAYNLYENQNNPEDDGASELMVEYGMSFATAITGKGGRYVTSIILNELIDLLYATRGYYNQYVMTEFVEGKYSELEGHLRFKTILESLYMRGDGYTHHIYSVFKELFVGHDDFLQKHYEFTSADLLEAVIQFEDSFYCRAILPNGIPHYKSFKRFKEWKDVKGLHSFRPEDMQPMRDFLQDNPDMADFNGESGGRRIDDISEFHSLYRVRARKHVHQKVIEALAIEFGDNKEFLNPKFPGLPLNESLSNLKPAIKFNGEYYLFGFNLSTRNLFGITEKLIHDADPTYYNQHYLGNKFIKSRDNYLENKTATLFSAFIPNSKSHLNLKYKPGQLDASGNQIETELDLLLVSENANYIIEMKAGGLSAPSKRGALKSLTGQLSETIGYGAYQSYRAYKFICENESPEFYDNKGNPVNIDKSKKLFRVTVTLEHLSGYIANMHELKMLGILDNDVEFAWTCSLFDLIIFSEIIEKEGDFIDYLEKRLPLYTNPNFSVDDEIDLLGYFLEKGELVDKKSLKKVDNYKLNKTSQDIDNYFQKGGPKPQRKK